MTSKIDIQYAQSMPLPASEDEVVHIAMQVLKAHHYLSELTIRFVDLDEMHSLNKTYRHQDKPTNVLAFPSSIPKNIPIAQDFIGDVIICLNVVETESIAQNISFKAHLAHMIIHGILHLLGFDHIKSKDTIQMQRAEIQLLAKLGYDNPYTLKENNDAKN